MAADPTEAELIEFIESRRPITPEEEIIVLRRIRNYFLGPLFGAITRENLAEVGVDNLDEKQPILLLWENALEGRRSFGGPFRRIWVPDKGIVGNTASIMHQGASFGTVQMGGVAVRDRAQVEDAIGTWAERVIECRRGVYLCSSDAYFLTVQAVEDFLPDDEFELDDGVGDPEFLDSGASWCQVSVEAWKEAFLGLIARYG